MLIPANSLLIPPMDLKIEGKKSNVLTFCTYEYYNIAVKANISDDGSQSPVQYYR